MAIHKFNKYLCFLFINTTRVIHCYYLLGLLLIISRINQINMINNEAGSCRICFDDDFPNNPLLTPCECRGTSKYIHKTCLYIWIASQSSEALKKTCEICKSDYKLPARLTSHLTFTQRALRDPQLTCSLFIILFLFGLCSLSFIIVLKNQVVSYEKSVASFIFAVLIFFLCILCFLVITIKLLKKIFYIKPRNVYQIVPFDNESENSFASNSLSVLRIELAERNLEQIEI